MYVRFMFFRKATEFDEISQLIRHLFSKRQINRGDFVISIAKSFSIIMGNWKHFTLKNKFEHLIHAIPVNTVQFLLK